MKLKDLNPPNFSYKYLVSALAACISLPSHANTLEDSLLMSGNQQQPLQTEYLDYDNARAYSPSAGQRMGEWLTEELQQAPSEYYETALVWQSNTEAEAQLIQHNMLSRNIESFAKKKGNNDLLPLWHWIESMPTTGRVILPKQDPRYLQVNPKDDPVFQQGDSLIVHQRPSTVTVLFDDTQACKVGYEAGVRAKDYIDACKTRSNKTYQADDAYLILPDGTVQLITLANWNAQQQMAPIPGAWLWVPNTKNGWSQELAEEVANYIATQGIDLPLPNGQDQTPIDLSKTSLEKSRDLPISNSDWGITGLMQTPTARMQKAGTLATHISHTDPYTHYNIVLQPFERIETAVRYTNIDGVSYGQVSPNQDLKDKSIDIKLKLLKEDRWIPEVAVGWRDPAGTTLFGGEYLVANKRYGDFDFSLGMGWGYLGARGNIDNPLGLIHDRFDDRVADQKGEGGEISPKSWFTGPSSLFGGVQWHTPYDPLTLKVEYDGNDYKSESKFDESLNPDDIPVNVGLTWQDKDRGVSLSAGYERGDTATFALTLSGDLTELGKVKPKASQVQNVERIPTTQYSSLKYRINLGIENTSLTQNAPLLNAFSQATGWQATDLTINNGNVLLNVEDYSGVFIEERLEQGMEILSQVLPADTKIVQIQVSRYGEPVGVFNIDPQTWTQQYEQLLPPSQRIEQPLAITSAAPNYRTPATQFVAHSDTPKGSITFSPSIKQSIGGPDGYLFGIFADANVDYKLWQGAWVNADAQVRLADNYDKFDFTGHSDLERVRTHVGEYMTTSRVLMPNLQVNHFKSFGDNWYGLAYAGYLESMFAGVGAEVMYRQPNKPWAVGVDLNRVRQRDFDQHFGLQDYEVTTGNVSLYWDTPIYDVDMKLSAGQYLAGDKGVTLDLSRGFDNGVKMGGWITKTDVSSEEFGEGSMDKGVYVSIPFDTLFKQWSSGTAKLIYQPLIRDGGAKLGRKYTLYELTSPLDKSMLDIENPINQ